MCRWCEEAAESRCEPLCGNGCYGTGLEVLTFLVRLMERNARERRHRSHLDLVLTDKVRWRRPPSHQSMIIGHAKCIPSGESRHFFVSPDVTSDFIVVSILVFAIRNPHMNTRV